MQQVQLNELLEAGVHFGHQTRRWNPKMRKFIFTERNGIHIIHHFMLGTAERPDRPVHDTVLATMKQMTPPVVMTSLTTAAVKTLKNVGSRASSRSSQDRNSPRLMRTGPNSS